MMSSENISYMDKSIKEAYVFGIEMAIDEIRRTCLDEWPESLESVTYEKYELENENEIK